MLSITPCYLGLIMHTHKQHTLSMAGVSDSEEEGEKVSDEFFRITNYTTNVYIMSIVCFLFFVLPGSSDV